MPSRTIHTFTDELARLDAVATAEAVRSGGLHPSETVAAAIARAQAADPHLNAIVIEDFARATQRAAGRLEGPFAGVPIVLKDMVDLVGLPTRHGSEALAAAAPADHTTEIVQQMLDLGMVVLGKSTLPEYGFPPCTEFPTAAPTRNPWNLDHSPGGSSGGSAALVAAGVVPIAHAVDGGGSIRIPAACCGLVGLKPSRGRLIPAPAAKMLPVDIVADGVVSRTVRDTAFFFAEAEKRFYNPSLPRIGHVTTPPSQRLRFGAVIDTPVGMVDAPTRSTFEKTIRLLEGLGHQVEPITPPVAEQFASDFIHYYAMLAFSVRTAGRQLFSPTFDRTRLTHLTNGLAAHFRKHLLRTPAVLMRLRRSAAAVAPLFTRCDAILSPVVTTRPPAIGHLGMDLPFDVVFPRVVAWAGFTPLANAAGLPSLSLPLGHDGESNLPIGMMFTAASGQEGSLLQLALELEQAAPWPTLATQPHGR